MTNFEPQLRLGVDTAQPVLTFGAKRNGDENDASEAKTTIRQTSFATASNPGVLEVSSFNGEAASALGTRIEGCADPRSNGTGDTDVANKRYVDSVAQGLDVKPSVLLTTSFLISKSGLGSISFPASQAFENEADQQTGNCSIPTITAAMFNIAGTAAARAAVFTFNDDLCGLIRVNNKGQMYGEGTAGYAATQDAYAVHKEDKNFAGDDASTGGDGDAPVLLRGTRILMIGQGGTNRGTAPTSAETSSVHNGIYEVMGGVISNAEVIDNINVIIRFVQVKRAQHLEIGDQARGAFTFTERGNSQGAGFVVSNTSGSTGEVGVEALTFSQFSGAGGLQAGQNITITGSNEISCSATLANTSRIAAADTGTGLSVAGANLITSRNGGVLRTGTRNLQHIDDYRDGSFHVRSEEPVDITDSEAAGYKSTLVVGRTLFDNSTGVNQQKRNPVMDITITGGVGVSLAGATKLRDNSDDNDANYASLGGGDIKISTHDHKDILCVTDLDFDADSERSGGFALFGNASAIDKPLSEGNAISDEVKAFIGGGKGEAFFKEANIGNQTGIRSLSVRPNGDGVITSFGADSNFMTNSLNSTAGDGYLVNNPTESVGACFSETGILTMCKRDLRMHAGKIQISDGSQIQCLNMPSAVAAVVITGGTGLKLEDGGANGDAGIIVGGGNISMESGDISMASGHITISQGNLTLTDGQATAKSFIATSDRNLKQDIQYSSAAHCLEQVMTIKPCTYAFKTDPSKCRSGVIAQDLRETMPALVEVLHSGESNEHLAVNYVDMISSLVGAIQALQIQVAEIRGD